MSEQHHDAVRACDQPSKKGIRHGVHSPDIYKNFNFVFFFCFSRGMEGETGLGGTGELGGMKKKWEKECKAGVGTGDRGEKV